MNIKPKIKNLKSRPDGPAGKTARIVGSYLGSDTHTHMFSLEDTLLYSCVSWDGSTLTSRLSAYPFMVQQAYLPIHVRIQAVSKLPYRHKATVPQTIDRLT